MHTRGCHSITGTREDTKAGHLIKANKSEMWQTDTPHEGQHKTTPPAPRRSSPAGAVAVALKGAGGWRGVAEVAALPRQCDSILRAQAEQAVFVPNNSLQRAGRAGRSRSRAAVCARHARATVHPTHIPLTVCV